jgi:hypothetical protein
VSAVLLKGLGIQGMKQVGLLAVFVASFSLLSWVQTPVLPTLDQCREDAKAFQSNDAVDLPTAANLIKQSEEMHVCAISVDPLNGRQYQTLVDKFVMAYDLRMSSFLLRHNLYSQFVAEDEAGKR